MALFATCTYQEAAGIALVPADEYDVLFMTSPDVYLASSLAREDLLAAAEPGALLTGSDFFAFGGLPNNFYLGTPQAVAAVAGRLSEAFGCLDQLTSHDAWRWALQVMRGADGVHRLPPEQGPNGSGRSGPVVSGRPWNSEQICMRYARKHGLRLSTSSLVWSKIRATGDLSPTHVYTL